MGKKGRERRRKGEGREMGKQRDKEEGGTKKRRKGRKRKKIINCVLTNTDLPNL